MVRFIHAPFEDREMALLAEEKEEKESWHDFLLRRVVGEDWRERV